MVHPQNFQLLNVQLQNVQLQKRPVTGRFVDVPYPLYCMFLIPVRLVTAVEVSIDESSLTGEVEPTHKTAQAVARPRGGAGRVSDPH